MSARIKNMAIALYAAHNETTFSRAMDLLPGDVRDLDYYRMAAAAIEHIPYLPPEEPESCITCGNITNPCDKQPGPPGYADGYSDAKEAIAAFMDVVILSEGQRNILKLFIKSLVPST